MPTQCQPHPSARWVCHKAADPPCQREKGLLDCELCLWRLPHFLLNPAPGSVPGPWWGPSQDLLPSWLGYGCSDSGSAMVRTRYFPELPLGVSRVPPFLQPEKPFSLQYELSHMEDLLQLQTHHPARGFLARGVVMSHPLLHTVVCWTCPGPPKILSPEIIAGTWAPNMSYIFAYATPGTHAPGDHLADLFCAYGHSCPSQASLVNCILDIRQSSI